jgi:poly-gamma-glutamate synthesis protein (capsule biosynthesis protein)
MVFLGDIACPDEKIRDLRASMDGLELFQNEIVVYNLEGNIVPRELVKNDGLHNSPEITSLFSGARKVIVSLANNHTYDYPDQIEETQRMLKDNDIGFFGIVSPDGKNVPYEFQDMDTGEKFAFFGHCWRMYTETNPNRVNELRIVDCSYESFCESVRQYIESHANAKVICFMHWNYDLEILPFPMLRDVSRQLIDIGVEAVIGSHSHVPQGIEIYKGKLIAYCLGNCYIPSGYYYGGTLIYPLESKEAYAVKLNTLSGDWEYEWFCTDHDNSHSVIEFELDEEAANEKMKKISPFSDMYKKDYLKYFSSHRKKGFLVPFYIRYKGVVHSLEEWFGIYRIKLIKFFNR